MQPAIVIMAIGIMGSVRVCLFIVKYKLPLEMSHLVQMHDVVFLKDMTHACWQV